MHSAIRLVVFMSEDSHYSIYKMAALLGIGEKNVVSVNTDNFGRMNVNHLEQLIDYYSKKPNYHPFMVVGTAGEKKFVKTSGSYLMKLLILFHEIYFW